MPLSNDQIQQIVKENRNQKEVQQGIKHQERLRFHTETILHKTELSPYYKAGFLDWIGEEHPEILAKDKFERFEQLIKAPIQTIELTESIYSRLFRVFFSQNAFFNYQFTDDSLNADWEIFKESKFWPTMGFQAMQTAIDSVWVVDLPSEQMGEFPEPTNRLIDIADVISIKNNEDNDCIYVIFRHGDFIFVYDDRSFWVYAVHRGVISAEPEIQIEHGLGYTPARMMWSEKLKAQNFINKESPVTKELTDLDWLLFHMTSKRYMDVANAYPIYAAYLMGKDYTDDDISENEQRKSGKRPSGADLMGAGTLIEGKMPEDSTQHDPMQFGPIKVIGPDVDALKWHVAEEVRLKDDIFKSVVGADTEVRNDAAKNEKQIDAAFESQASVLFRVKKNFEIIHKFADSTICRLRYGDRFIDCEIDYGTNFFLKDVSDLQEDLKIAKESGASEVILESISNDILSTQYRDDTHSIMRAKIINDLNPLPNSTKMEAMDLHEAGGIDKINFIIKSNLISFVGRFERENLNLVDFGSLRNYAEKIKLIKESLISYANEQLEQPAPGV